MTADWQTFALTAGLIASAVAGGTFFAFSNFVMPALSKLADTNAVAAMQSINRAAPSPGFVSALLGSMFAGVPVAAATLGNSRGWLSCAAAALGGLSLAITMGRNVPQNNALDTLDAVTPEASTYWRRYLRVWTRDNTLRGIASIASAVAYAAAIAT